MRKQKLSASEIAKKSAKIKTKIALLQDEYNAVNNVKVTEFRFGNFKVRLSDMKVDISPIPTKENQGQILSSHTYRLGSDVFMAFYIGLSKFKLDVDKQTLSAEKTEEEIQDGQRMVSYFINSLYHLSMFLTDNQFASDYIQLVTKTIERQKPVEITKEQDDEILDELKRVEEAKEIVSEVVE
jgi:hypothetical protein